MEDSKLLCLLLPEFKDNVSLAWQHLKDSQDFSDVTLACENKQLPAHRLVLAACSPVFNDLLKFNPHQNPIIYLRGVKYCELVNILEFVYTGMVNIEQEQLNGFLAVARDLCIKGLTEEDNEGNANFEELLNYDDLLKEKVKTEKDEAVLENMIDEYMIMKENITLDENITEDAFKSKLLQNVMVEMENESNDMDLQTNDTLDSKAVPSLQYKTDDQTVEMDQIEKSVHISDSKHIKQEKLKDDHKEKDAKQEKLKDDHKEKDANLIYKNDKKRKIDDNDLHSCESCEYTSSKKFLLTRHILAYHDENVKFSCEQCLYKSSTKGNLKKHIRAVHEGLRYPCDLCNFKATQKSFLTHHIKNVHSL